MSMFVQFLRSVTAQNQHGAHFDAGCVVELAEDAARHWVVRRAAQYVDRPESKEPEHADHEEEVLGDVQENPEEDHDKRSRKGRK